MKSEICMPCVCLNDADASKPGLRPAQHERAATRLVCAAVAVGLVSCLFVTGCASSRGGKSSGQAPAGMTVLGDSIEPLRQQFNADKDKLRVLALFSPT
jgi:hypothetical protein